MSEAINNFKKKIEDIDPTSLGIVLDAVSKLNETQFIEFIKANGIDWRDVEIVLTIIKNQKFLEQTIDDSETLRIAKSLKVPFSPNSNQIKNVAILLCLNPTISTPSKINVIKECLGDDDNQTAKAIELNKNAYFLSSEHKIIPQTWDLLSQGAIEEETLLSDFARLSRSDFPDHFSRDVYNHDYKYLIDTFTLENPLYTEVPVLKQVYDRVKDQKNYAERAAVNLLFLMDTYGFTEKEKIERITNFAKNFPSALEGRGPEAFIEFYTPIFKEEERFSKAHLHFIESISDVSQNVGPAGMTGDYIPANTQNQMGNYDGRGTGEQYAPNGLDNSNAYSDSLGNRNGFGGQGSNGRGGAADDHLDASLGGQGQGDGNGPTSFVVNVRVANAGGPPVWTKFATCATTDRDFGQDLNNVTQRYTGKPDLIQPLLTVEGQQAYSMINVGLPQNASQLDPNDNVRNLSTAPRSYQTRFDANGNITLDPFAPNIIINPMNVGNGNLHVDLGNGLYLSVVIANNVAQSISAERRNPNGTYTRITPSGADLQRISEVTLTAIDPDGQGKAAYQLLARGQGQQLANGQDIAADRNLQLQNFNMPQYVANYHVDPSFLGANIQREQQRPNPITSPTPVDDVPPPSPEPPSPSNNMPQSSSGVPMIKPKLKDDSPLSSAKTPNSGTIVTPEGTVISEPKLGEKPLSNSFSPDNSQYSPNQGGMQNNWRAKHPPTGTSPKVERPNPRALIPI